MVTIQLPDEHAAALAARAAAEGLPLETWLMKMASAETAALDWSQCDAVERAPGKVSGAWVVKGTRMPVAAIFENLQAGASVAEILDWFDGLNRKQVEAVIEFAARSLDRPPSHEP